MYSSEVSKAQIHKTSYNKIIRSQSSEAVEDFSSGCGLKFDAVIVSKKFDGKQLLARQRLVNEIIKNEMTEIHAFTQKTYTPDEWEKKQQKAMANPE
ncbi:unnamed protein product [Rotaria magnacalcarata]